MDARAHRRAGRPRRPARAATAVYYDLYNSQFTEATAAGVGARARDARWRTGSMRISSATLRRRTAPERSGRRRRHSDVRLVSAALVSADDADHRGVAGSRVAVGGERIEQQVEIHQPAVGPPAARELGDRVVPGAGSTGTRWPAAPTPDWVMAELFGRTGGLSRGAGRVDAPVRSADPAAGRYGIVGGQIPPGHRGRRWRWPTAAAAGRTAKR